jgi:hypothetical protein
MTQYQQMDGTPAWWEERDSDGAWANAWCPNWEVDSHQTPSHVSPHAAASFTVARPSPLVAESLLDSTRSTVLGARTTG